MYAVVKSGGKQYRVKEGQTVKLEKMDVEIGSTIKLDSVLMIASDTGDVEMGTPLLENAVVEAAVLSQGRHKKVKIIKFRRRKHHMKQMGHRQYFTEVEITKIAK
jgi:large subunit ribosomal protein L21